MRGEFSLPRQYAHSCSLLSPSAVVRQFLLRPDLEIIGVRPRLPRQVPSFDLTAIDKTIDPCVDFYQYACGNWMKNNPIPADKSRWGRFNELAEYNLYVLRDILDQTQTPGQHSAIQKKVGDYYAACMDEAAIEKKGIAPLTPTMNAIAAIKTKPGLIEEVGVLQRNGVSALFSFGQMPDMHDSRQTIANIDQGGLTLPDRDYYLKDDAKSVETRQKYLEHVQKMFELAGDKPEVAAAEAKTVLAVETGLAKADMDRTARRDPKNRDHMMQVTEVDNPRAQLRVDRVFRRQQGAKVHTA